MCLLHIHAQSYSRSFEVLPEEAENAELVVEDAQCSSQSCALPLHAKESMKCAVEESVNALLKELFGSVKVDSITLDPSPWDYWNDPALSRSV